MPFFQDSLETLHMRLGRCIEFRRRCLDVSTGVPHAEVSQKIESVAKAIAHVATAAKETNEP